jgi:diadenylate cyclase
MRLLSKYLTPARIVTLRSRSKEGAIRELARALALTVRGLDPERVVRAIQEREKIVSSWVGQGIAIPHARLSSWDGIVVAVGRSRRGISYDSSDGNPVNLLILIVSDDRDPDTHILLLAEIARTLRDLALRQLIMTARTGDEVHRLLVTHGYGEAEKKPKAPAKVRLSRLLFAHALSVAEEVKATAILVHADAIGSFRFLEDIPSGVKRILVTSRDAPLPEGGEPTPSVLRVPFPALRRSDQVELALLFAVSRGLLSRGDTVVSLSGAPNSGSLDSLLVIDISREFPTVLANPTATPLGDVEPQVLEKVLQSATDIAREGREGRPVGTTFVVGDYARVLPYCRQMVINPFRGYRNEEKNILDPSLGETVKEFSTIDGAFILRGDGVIMSAGTFLRPDKSAVSLPPGLGARHAAAAALTAFTASLAVVISQSTGAVTLFKGGGLLMSLEKPRGPGA